MVLPQGSVTGPQFEILQILWQNPEGMTVAEIWQRIREQRDVSRTTVLNLVDRLEKREWLTREKQGGIYRYQASISEGETQEMLASEFVGKFYGGSATEFVLSFLGSQKLSKKELDRMRKALDDKTGGRKKSKSGTQRKDKRK